MKNQILSLFIVLLLAGCASAPVGTTYFSLDDLQEKIDERFSDPMFSHAHWGVKIESLTSGKVWYERNADRMFMPASNEKIITSSAALTKLGPDFQFTTELKYSGTIEDSVLKGDIIVCGNGDPSFYTKFYDQPTEQFEVWADSLLTLGIKKIVGNIIGDDNLFDDQHIGDGWPLDGLGAWYSAEVGPLQINENYVDLKIIPPANAGDSVIVEPNLPSSFFTLNNTLIAVDTGRTRIRIDRAHGTNEIILTGEVLAGTKPFERTPSLTNPTKFYVTVLREVFNEKGIEVMGSALDCDELKIYDSSNPNTTNLITHKSPKLFDLLKQLMKRSQNMYAETMVRILGLEYEGHGSFRNGKKVVEEVMNGFGIEPGSYSYVDGSGLTRYNFVSPAQLVKILKAMWQSEYSKEWYEIQPIAGVDGTLRRRMKSTKAEGNVHAKTGTISNVRGLSGYVKTAEGEDVVFSFLINGHLLSSRDTELITDSVLEVISEYPLVSDSYIKE